MLNKSIYIICAFVLNISYTLNALNLKGLDLIEIINTPSNEFFGSVSIILDAKSSWICELGNGYIIEVIPWNNKSIDDYWEPSTEFKLYKSGDGLENEPSLIASKTIKSKKGLSALRIEQGAMRILLTSSGGLNLFSDLINPVPPLKVNSQIKVYASSLKHLKNIKNKFEEFPSRENIKLDNHTFNYQEIPLENSHVGEWRYLDRITPKNHRSAIGGKYNIEIIPNIENAEELLLIYMDGAIDNASSWKKGDVKGRLIPTAFDNHYDLIWYDTYRWEAGLGECSATFEGIDLLTLDFPLLECQIRFQRFLPENIRKE